MNVSEGEDQNLHATLRVDVGGGTLCEMLVDYVVPKKDEKGLIDFDPEPQRPKEMVWKPNMRTGSTRARSTRW